MLLALAIPALAWTAVYYKDSDGVAGRWYNSSSIASVREGGYAYSYLYVSRMKVQTNAAGPDPEASGGNAVEPSHIAISGTSRCRDDSPYEEPKYAHRLQCYYKRS